MSFGGAPAAGFTVISDTQIIAISPPATAGSVVDVTVTTGAGTWPTSAADQFTYFGPRVYVANQQSNPVSVIDADPGSPTFNSVIATVTVGTHPRGVAVAPDSGRVYVTNQGGNSVSVIETSGNTVANTVPVGAAPDAVAVSPDGTAMYVANTAGASVSVVDTTTGAYGVINLAVGTNPTAFAVAPDGSRVYVTDQGSNWVSVIDTSSPPVYNVINVAVGTGPYGVGYAP